jgi:protein-tyrosine phosphatase
MRTELHTHLLPGVDDGPRDDAQALALARLAVADGTRTVVATPHVSMVDVATIPDRVRRLGEVLRREGVPIEVLPGGELSPADVFGIAPDELAVIAQGPSSGRWLLLEAPLMVGGRGLREAAAELRGYGYDVLIGHPERSPAYSLHELSEHVRQGSAIQINASSLVGRHGRRAQQAGLEIARSGLPFVLASDAHSDQRPPLLSAGARVLATAGLDADTIAVAVDTGAAVLLSDGLAPLLARDLQPGRWIAAARS